MAIPSLHHRITVEEYEQMIADGVLTENDRVELIAGEIVPMAAFGIGHLNSVNYLNKRFANLEEARLTAIVSVQNSIRLPPDWEPQPDIALLRDAPYRAVPGVADVLLVIEVADTTRLSERNTKIPRYAAAGIAEAWLVDLVARRVERYSDPRPDGYDTVVRASLGESLTSITFPAFTLETDAIVRAADGVR